MSKDAPERREGTQKGTEVRESMADLQQFGGAGAWRERWIGEGNRGQVK